MGKVIQVRNEEVFVYDSKLKKKKLNAPVKGKGIRRVLPFTASHNQDQNEGCENKQFELHNSDDSKDVSDSSNMTENFEQLSDFNTTSRTSDPARRRSARNVYEI